MNKKSLVKQIEINKIEIDSLKEQIGLLIKAEEKNSELFRFFCLQKIVCIVNNISFTGCMTEPCIGNLTK